MHAPPRPAPTPGEMAAPGRPGPENFHINCTRLIIESFVNFQIVRYLQNISTFIAIDLSSNHL